MIFFAWAVFLVITFTPPPEALRPNAGHGLLILEVSRSHTTTHHSRKDSSGLVISSSQRPLPDNTQHSQQTSMPPVGFEPTVSVDKRPQTDALDRAATGTGCNFYGSINFVICVRLFMSSSCVLSRTPLNVVLTSDRGSCTVLSSITTLIF